jgi:tripartite-type tricarboxylate transporter receptor subunit TctC
MAGASAACEHPVFKDTAMKKIDLCKPLIGRRPALKAATLLVVGALIGAANAPVAAQGQRPLTIIVPYTPGSGPDILARAISPGLGDKLGRPVVVDNKAGASGNIGADFVAKSKPDGSTLMLTVNTFTITPALYKSLPYDPIADFTPIGKLAIGSMAIVSTASLPVHSFDDLVKYAKANPDRLNYGSPGNGTPQHVGMEVLKSRLGIELLHVPYKGAGGATADLLGGQTQVMLLPVHTALPFVRSEKLRMLAMASSKRSSLAPDVPSLGELGVEGVDANLYFWLAGPAGLPADQVKQINRHLADVLASGEIKSQLAVQGLTVDLSDPATISASIQSDVARWKKFIAEQKITMD